MATRTQRQTRQLNATRAAVDRRAKGLASVLERLFERRRVALLRDLTRKGPQALMQRAVKKAVDPIEEDAFLEELFGAILRYGLLQATESAARTAVILEGSLRLGGAGRLVPLKEFKGLEAIASAHAREIARVTQVAVSQKIERVINDARSMDVEPSTRELILRLREEITEVPALSWERADTIARTELSIAENVGTFSQYEDAGVEELEWLAFSAPIWPRRHDLMHGERAKVGDYFTTPGGVKLRFPGDPLGPAGEIINCRCSTAPVIPVRKIAVIVPGALEVHP